MSQTARDAITGLRIDWKIDGENNGKPIRTFNAYGHEARVAFGFDRRWGSVIDQRGILFAESDETLAVEYAERTIRERLLARLDAAEKLHADIAPLLAESQLMNYRM